MEKIIEKLKIVVVMLLVILLSIAAFWGIFLKEKGAWKNVIPDYQYGMDLEGTRELRYKLDTSEEEKYVYVDENGNIMGEVWKEGKAITAEDETTSEETESTEDKQEEQSEKIENSEEIPYTKETRTIKVNSDDKLNKENFEQAKKMIQKRFKEQEIAEYNLRIDDVTGDFVVETANNEDASKVQELISSTGKFQVIDYQNGVVLMDHSDIQKVSVVSSNESAYNTYLQIEFNKEGAEKLREISKKYVEIKQEAVENEEENSEETTETEKKYVSIVFDGTTMMTTYFGEEMTAGVLQISVGQARTEYEDFVEDYRSAKRIADILNSGVLPVTYQLGTDNFIKSEFTNEDKNTLKIVCIVVIALASLILLIKFKKNGLLAAVLSIGYIALLSIVARYTNVIITQNSMIAYGIVILLNYLFIKLILRKLATQEIDQAYAESAKQFYLATLPIDVIAIVFTFSKYTPINSIGMILFWGMILNAIYHLVLTRSILKKQ